MTLPAGSIELYDAVDPGLDAGVYRVTSNVELSPASFAAPPANASFIDVGGPRFSLGPAEVAARHPPPAARADVGQRLPHVVLGRRTLPWERRGPGSQTWLALLVARKDTEAKVTVGPLQSAVGAATLAALRAIELVADPSEPVSVVTFSDVNVLSAILPTPAELDLLCHVRRVNTADGALDLGDDDGWFSVVTANRLPQGSAEGVDYVACLVSLEGRTDITSLPAPGTTPPAPAPPLIALATWEFTSLDTGGTFEHLAESLDVAGFGTASPAAPGGTVTLARTDRAGATAPATYRGPLLGWTPSAAPPLPAGDVSLESAFELGRLLGAADGRFTREIVDWHRTIDHEAQAQASAAVVAEAVGEDPQALRATAAPAHVAVGARVLRRVAEVHPAADRWGVPPAARALAGGAAAGDPADALSALGRVRRTLDPGGGG